MTKSSFIATVEAKPNFIKWLGDEVLVETIGTARKYRRDALITSDAGFPNVFQVWYIEDTATGDTNFQNVDTLTPTENAVQKKQDALTAYLKANFNAFRLIWTDLDNTFAEAEVFATAGADLTRSKVLVYKIGANPITHKLITN